MKNFFLLIIFSALSTSFWVNADITECFSDPSIDPQSVPKSVTFTWHRQNQFMPKYLRVDCNEYSSSTGQQTTFKLNDDCSVGESNPYGELGITADWKFQKPFLIISTRSHGANYVSRIVDGKVTSGYILTSYDQMLPTCWYAH